MHDCFLQDGDATFQWPAGRTAPRISTGKAIQWMDRHSLFPFFFFSFLVFAAHPPRVFPSSPSDSACSTFFWAGRTPTTPLIAAGFAMLRRWLCAVLGHSITRITMQRHDDTTIRRNPAGLVWMLPPGLLWYSLSSQSGSHLALLPCKSTSSCSSPLLSAHDDDDDDDHHHQYRSRRKESAPSDAVLALGAGMFMVRRWS